MAGVAYRVDHGDEAAQGVPVDDRPADTERVAEVADSVGTRLEAPARRVAPLGTAMTGQVQVNDLRYFRQPCEVGLEVGVVEAPGPAVQQHDGGPLSHLRAVGHERQALDVEPEPLPVHVDLHAPPF